MDSLYLDYAATTPVDQAVADEMMKYLTADGIFANPASRSHLYGWQAESAVEQARLQLATLVGCETRELVWTSGATESNNVAIKGLAEATSERGKHLITSPIEHKAVLDCFEWLEKRGWEISYVRVETNGALDLDQLSRLIRKDTTLISVMHVNNETGSINPIAEIGALARQHNVYFHVDAAQSVGKIPIDLSSLPIDSLSMSAHKFYGPKGIGALYVRRSLPFGLPALIHGGGHERGMRSGTLPTHQIVGMGKAAEIAREKISADYENLVQKREALLSTMGDIKGLTLHGSSTDHFPAIVNFGIEGVDGEVLMSALPKLALSSGSACTSASIEPSHVLTEMAVPKSLALASLRLSIGRNTTLEECVEAGQYLSETISKLQRAI